MVTGKKGGVGEGGGGGGRRGRKSSRTRTRRFQLCTFHVLTSPVLSSLLLRIEISWGTHDSCISLRQSSSNLQNRSYFIVFLRSAKASAWLGVERKTRDGRDA